MSADDLCPTCGRPPGDDWIYCTEGPDVSAGVTDDYEPTEEDLDAAYAVWSRDFMAKPMREIIRDILRAPREARR